MLETERLTLTQPDASCVEALIAFYKSERSSMAGGNVSEPEAVTRSYSMLGHWVHRGYGLFALHRKTDQALVGMAGPFFPARRPEVEVGWILFDGYEGFGYATEGAKAAVAFARESLQWKTMVHYIDEANGPSIAVAERIGAFLDEKAESPKPNEPLLVYRQPTLD